MLMIAILIVSISKTINYFGKIISNGHEDENYEKIETKSHRKNRKHKQRRSKNDKHLEYQNLVSTLTKTIKNCFQKIIIINKFLGIHID